MPGVLQGLSDYTPLGAAVEAIQDSMPGGFPPVAPLLVLAAYALVFGFPARSVLPMGVARHRPRTNHRSAVTGTRHAPLR
jgi:hypothetical protein